MLSGAELVSKIKGIYIYMQGTNLDVLSVQLEISG
jgi:hypothetical protein